MSYSYPLIMRQVRHIVPYPRQMSLTLSMLQGMSVYAAAELLESLPASITLQVSRELKDSLRVANRESSVVDLQVDLQKRGADSGSADVESAFPRVADVRVGLLRVRKFSAGVSSAVAQVLVA